MTCSNAEDIMYFAIIFFTVAANQSISLSFEVCYTVLKKI